MLWVTEEASWIEGITRTGRAAVSNRFSAGLALATNENIRSQPSPTQAAAVPTNGAAAFRLNQIPDFALTNELGQPIRLGDFEGRALAMTFFFTRCPIPEYCPRLTRNFSGAIQRLKALPDGPTNYHFLSVSFDPVDSPLLLRAYAQQYRYDSNHWSFVTGKPEDVRELAEGFGVPIIPSTGSGQAPSTGAPAGATFYNHGFRTLIFDATGGLQATWPIGGDVTDHIVDEMTKAARVRR